MNFEQQYQAQFAPMAKKFPIGKEVKAFGTVYIVSDYFIDGKTSGFVGVDAEGNEKHITESNVEKVCRRCAGTGKFSYNQTHGTTCYGCGGTGLLGGKMPNKKTKRFQVISKINYYKSGMNFGFSTGEVYEAIPTSFKDGKQYYQVGSMDGMISMSEKFLSENFEVTK